MSRTSTVLTEHNRIIAARHFLALFNFLVILAGSVVTQYFLSVRGTPNGVIAVADVIIAINVVQFGLCLADYITQKFFGLYVKVLVPITYAVGGVWLLLLAAEMLLSTLAMGIVRIDLIVIVAVQIVTALVAYLLWAVLNRRALDALMRSSVRDDDDKRVKKANHYVGVYILLAAAVLVAQVGALFLYQIPPKVYDLFDGSRALGYELYDNGRGYVVSEVYSGTSSLVNVPATYNNLPVLGIKDGALAEENVAENEKVYNITFGTPMTDEETGTTTVVSYLEFIDSGAIVNNQIETITLPASLTRIGGYSVTQDVGAVNMSAVTRAGETEPAISSSSLKTIVYQARADFELFDYACDALRTITMSGESVGAITSVEGLSNHTTIEVSKDIYNTYREDNIAYAHNFRPLIAENEFCVDFYTDCDVYIDSIIASSETTVEFSHLSTLVRDTTAYNADDHELGTEGAKADSAFRGWYTDSACSNEYKIATGEEMRFNKSMELYAKWVHEYTAELDWGNYKDNVVGVEKIQHWTDERAERLPGYEGRLGYSAGVSWHVGNLYGTAVSDTATLHNNVTLVAEWLLDKPAGIDILPNKMGDEDGVYVSDDKDTVSFTYDEARMVHLEAQEGTHALKDNGVTLSHEWFKQGNENESLGYTLLELENVAQSGVYILRVTARATEGQETASSETKVNVSIGRKALDVAKSGVIFGTETREYSGGTQTLVCTDAEDYLSRNAIDVKYEYTAKNASAGASLGSNGVKDVGEYHVKATFSKNNEAARANYEEESMEADFTITQKSITKATWKGKGSGWNGTNITYNKQLHEIYLEIGAGEVFPQDTVAFEYDESGTYTTKGTDAGDYTAKAFRLNNDNYKIGDEIGLTCEWRIDPKEVTVQQWQINGRDNSSASVEYSGSAITVAAVLLGAEPGDTVNFNYVTGGTEVVSATKAGSYRSKIAGVNNTNYTFDPETGDKATFDWNITKKKLILSFGENESLTYNGQAQGVTATVTGFVGGDESHFEKNFFQYTAENLTDTPSNSGGNYIIKFTATNAATYTVTFTGLNSEVSDEVLANYELQTSGSTMEKSFTIAQKQLTFNTAFRTYTYDGTTQNLYLAVEGIAASDLAGVQLSQFGTTATGGQQVSGVYCLVYQQKDAGNCAVQVQSFSNENYRLEEFNGEINIAKRPVSISKWNIKDDSKEGTAQELKAGASFVYNFYGYTVSVELTGVAASEEVKLQLTSANGKDAKGYTTSATLPETYTNYTLTGTTEIGWTIAPYALNFTWKMNGSDLALNASYEYSGNDYTPTATYEKLGTDEITIDYTPDGGFVKTAKNVGSYTKQVSATGNSNYTIGQNATYTWDITPATVTVAFTSGSYIYNGQYQGPSFTLTGLMEPDFENISIRASVSGTPFVGSAINDNIDFDHTGSAYSFTDTHGFAVDAGSYSVRISAIRLSGIASSNYSITSSGALESFSIAQKEVTFTGKWQYSNDSAGNGEYLSNTTITYNRSQYTLTTAFSAGVLVTRLESRAADEVTIEYSGNTGTDYSASGYTAAVTGLSGQYANNYKLPSSSSPAMRMSWKIAQKEVKFTAWTNTSQTFKNSELSVTTGYDRGASADDDFKVYTGDTLTLSYSNNTATAVGHYTAKVTGIGNSNYTFSPQDASASQEWDITQYVINELNWTFDAIDYNGKDQYPTATFEKFGMTVKVTNYDYPVGGAKKASSSKYTITAKAIDNASFTLSGCSNISHEYTINKKTLEIEWVESVSGSAASSYNFVYTGNVFTLAAKATNLCEGDSVQFSYRAENPVTFTDAGSHTASISSISDGTNNENYQLGSNTSVRVEVKKQVVSVSWSGASKAVTYDGAEHNAEFTATVSGTKEGRPYTVSSAVSVVGGTAAKAKGSYTFRVDITLGDTNNYTLEGVADTTRTLTINAKPLTVRWTIDGAPAQGSSSTYTYHNDKSHKVEAELNGKCGSDVVTASYSITNTVKNVGDYSITVSLSGSASSNYTLDGIDNKTYEVHINKQKTNVVWSGNGTRVYDGSSHKPTAVVTGADDSETLTATVGGSAITNVGSATFTLSLGSSYSSNYELATADTTRTLTITAATASIAWGATEFTYDGESHAITYTVTDKTNGGTLNTRDYSVVGVTAGGLSQTNAGSYKFTFTLNTENYVLESAGSKEATMTIKPATVTVTWGTTEFEEDGEEHYITPKLTVDTKADVTDNYEFNGTHETAAKTYTFTLTLTSQNFVFEDGTRTKTVQMKITEKAAAVPEEVAYSTEPDSKRAQI